MNISRIERLKSIKNEKCDSCGNTRDKHSGMIHAFIHTPPKLPLSLANNPYICKEPMCYNYGKAPTNHLYSCTFGKTYCEKCRNYASPKY